MWLSELRTLLIGLRIWCCCELQHRLELQLRLGVAVTAAPVQPPAWELPCATGTAVKRKKKKKSYSCVKNMGFQTQHWKFLVNSHVQPWKVQMISKGSASKGTNFGGKETFCTGQLCFSGSLIFLSLSILLLKTSTMPDSLACSVNKA